MSIEVSRDPAGVAGGWDAHAPDAALTAMLEAVDPGDLCGEDLAGYTRAAQRVGNRSTARLHLAIGHLARAQDGRTDRLAASDRYSGDEVAGVLGWSRAMADRRLALAEDLADRLAVVGEAMWSGVLDESKARVFSEWTRDLSEDHARHVCAGLLADAASMPNGALIEAIETEARALDPEWWARRQKRAEANGRVILSPNPSGTANLTIADATPDEGLAMRDRVDALAAAARALGVETKIGPLRKAIAVRLLDGTYAGLGDEQIVLAVAGAWHTDHPTPTDPDDDNPDDGPDDTGDNGPDGGPDDGPNGSGDDDDGPNDDGPDDPGDDDGGPNDDGGPDDDGPDDDGPDGGGPGAGAGSGKEPKRPCPEDTGPADPATDPADPAADPADPADPSGPAADPAGRAGQGVLDLDLPEATDLPMRIDPPPVPGQVRAGGSEIRVRLSTVLGLDQLPAHVPGYGIVLAGDARHMLGRRRRGQWRVVFVDDDGHLEDALLLRHRPRGQRSDQRPAGPRGHEHPPRGIGKPPIVELQVPTTLLGALDPDEHPHWAAVIRELQARLADPTRTPGRPPDHRAGGDELARRRARAEVELWIRVRDRTCLVPWCTRPASVCELDHTHDYALGGATASWNLGAVDKHHHRAKHHARWRIRQPRPGHFEIRTRAGLTYHTTPTPILQALPEPRPADPPRPLPDDGHGFDLQDDDPQAWRTRWDRRTTPRPAPRPPHRNTTPPVDTDLNDPPPF